MVDASIFSSLDHSSNLSPYPAPLHISSTLLRVISEPTDRTTSVLDSFGWRGFPNYVLPQEMRKRFIPYLYNPNLVEDVTQQVIA
jgi:hypothetical protein